MEQAAALRKIADGINDTEHEHDEGGEDEDDDEVRACVSAWVGWGPVYTHLP